MRDDILELSALGTSLGLRMLLSTNGSLLSPTICEKIKKAGIKRLSLSLDGPDRESHDAFRGLQGSYDSVIRGASELNDAKLPFQINSTITPQNITQIEKITKLSSSIGAVAHHVFLLVPVGRAKSMEEVQLSPDIYEEALKQLKLKEPFIKMEFKATCAPQYQRIGRMLGQENPRSGKGCLGGQGFMFISHDGYLQACGYLPIQAGSVRETHIVELYNNSSFFNTLRDPKKYHGKCSICEYWHICGGCRARAHAMGDYLGPEPLCPHEPVLLKRASHA
jgi:radical SAM protein with 4Fe4S-binding SPASM domain